LRGDYGLDNEAKDEARRDNYIGAAKSGILMGIIMPDKGRWLLITARLGH